MWILISWDGRDRDVVVAMQGWRSSVVVAWVAQEKEEEEEKEGSLLPWIVTMSP